MYRVLIVDDEEYTRTGMREALNWRAIGCDVVADAHDGVRALEVLADVSPDIVLTDIRMPRMDGLSLIKAARELYPTTKFVVLSAYDEFHLVQEAFRLGASDYLLKSEVTDHELSQVVEKVTLEIRSEHRARERAAENALATILEEKRTPSAEEVLRFRTVDVDLTHTYTCVVIQIGRLSGAGADTRDQVRQRVAAELCAEGFTVLAHWRNADTLAAIVQPAGDRSWGDLKDHLVRGFRRFCQSVVPAHRVVPSGGISRLYREPDQLPSALQEASICRQMAFYGDRYTLCAVQIGGDTFEHNLPGVRGLPSLLAEALTTGSYLEDSSLECRLQLPAVRYGLGKIERVRTLFTQYYWIIQEAGDHGGFSVRDTCRAELAEFAEWIRDFGVLSDLNGWIVRVIARLRDERSRSSRLVRKAAEYLRNHSAQQVSIGQLSADLGVSQSHLTRQFSVERGESPGEYLTRIRIGEAKKLLAETDMRIFEVADEVGYESAEHFSRLFKRMVGVTPRHYRSPR